jgi:hypothetical protein
MLKFRQKAAESSKALEEQVTFDTMKAVIKLDLPEAMYALKVSAAFNYSTTREYLSPENYDRFTVLID